MRRFAPVAHADRLSVVDHLSEFRTRLILCVVVFATLFGLCMWQDQPLLALINRPLTHATAHKNKVAEAVQKHTKELYLTLADVSRVAARDLDSKPDLRDRFERLATQAQATASILPRAGPDRPVTLGVAEPFTATLQVAFFAALLLSLPFLLYQLYAFILPAFSPSERRVAMPIMLSAPFLFAAGVAFGYFVALPNAVAFLQNFNTQNFDVLLQASDFYRFSMIVLIALGLLFQLPLGIVGMTTLGILTPAQLRSNRRYAVIGVAFLAMMIPGADPVTMLCAMVPLMLLYEGSILFATALERRLKTHSASDSQVIIAANTSPANET